MSIEIINYLLRNEYIRKHVLKHKFWFNNTFHYPIVIKDNFISIRFDSLVRLKRLKKILLEMKSKFKYSYAHCQIKSTLHSQFPPYMVIVEK